MWTAGGEGVGWVFYNEETGGTLPDAVFRGGEADTSSPQASFWDGSRGGGTIFVPFKIISMPCKMIFVPCEIVARGGGTVVVGGKSG
jgi:hypothetical protein